jgi:hypothetical protein
MVDPAFDIVYPSFDYACGVAVDEQKNIYVADNEGIRKCTAGLASCSTVIPGSPQAAVISIYGDTMYAGDYTGSADFITVCPLADMTKCTTTTGGGSFSGVTKVYRITLP